MAFAIQGGDHVWMDTLAERLRQNTPSGSEGPLRFEVYRKLPYDDYPDGMGGPVSRGFVCFWGDLRDFGEEGQVNALSRWISEAVTDDFLTLKFSIRQGIVHIWDEWNQNSIIMVWDFQKNQFVIQRMNKEEGVNSETKKD